VDMLAAGASGYLLKDCLFDEVLLAVRTVLSGSMYVSPRVVELVVKDFVQQASRDELSPLEEIQSRERKILRLAAEGRGPEEIASRLDMSVAAVPPCLQQIILDHIVPYFQGSDAGIKAHRAISFTAREREILTWIKEGKNTGEISSILGITRDTVKFHLKNVYQKLNTSSRSQAVALAIEKKIIDV
jgi:DNA-binding NarL/FixJ family response regulator